MLTMCIRALDYCPAVDITFGEYLRALITADIDAFPDDPRHYRLAFMESFRKWKLLPRDVRTVSEETLAWSTLDDPSPDWLHGLLGDIDLSWNQKLNRSGSLRAQREEPLGAVAGDEACLRGQSAISTAVRPAARPAALRPAWRGRAVRRAPGRAPPSTSSACGPPAASSPTARSAPRSSPSIHQRQLRPTGRRQGIGDGWFWFRGGATVIIDPRKDAAEIRYSIIKNTGSAEPAARQRRRSAANSCRRCGRSISAARHPSRSPCCTPSHEAMMAKTGDAQRRSDSIGGQKSQVTVRHYCQGIGDCHLLSFPRSGRPASGMLIDCGIHSSVKGGSGDRGRESSPTSRPRPAGKIDVLVVTHEHWDHCLRLPAAPAIFCQVHRSAKSGWPGPKTPPTLRRVELDKYKAQALAALQLASRSSTPAPAPSRLSGIPRRAAGVPRLPVRRQGRTGPRGARLPASNWRQEPRLFRARAIRRSRSPRARPAHLCARPAARQEVAQRRRKGERDVRAGPRRPPFARALLAGLAWRCRRSVPADDYAAPFDRSCRHGPCPHSPAGGTQRCRHRADVAGLCTRPLSRAGAEARDAATNPRPVLAAHRRRLAGGIAADLAMQLDRGVNNTSLVLAFEFIDTGRSCCSRPMRRSATG